MNITSKEIEFTEEEFDKWIRENSETLVKPNCPTYCLFAKFLDDNSSFIYTFSVGSYCTTVRKNTETPPSASSIPHSLFMKLMILAFDGFHQGSGDKFVPISEFIPYYEKLYSRWKSAEDFRKKLSEEPKENKRVGMIRNFHSTFYIQYFYGEEESSGNHTY